MRAFVWDGRGARVVQDHPEPSSSDEMALVEVRMAGVCSTDLQILQGYMDFRGILGHEFVGEVLEGCLLYTSPSPRDKRQSRMPSSA